MDFVFIAILLSATVAWLLILQALKQQRLPGYKLPPGPRPLPIVGNIFALGSNVHESLARLAQTYGPVMLLRLGSLNTIVISSPEAAKVVLRQHDQVLCNRTVPKVMWALDHHRYSVAWMPVDHQWRKIRKICKEKMFSMQKLDSSHDLRMDKLRKLIKHVDECSKVGRVVDIGRVVSTTTMNLISTSFFSIDVVEGYDSDLGQEFKDLVTGIATLAGKPNVADFFSIFERVDPQGLMRENTRYFQKLFFVLDEIIRKRIEMKRSATISSYIVKNDMLEDLLEDETGLSIDDIRHLIFDLFAAGSDTTSGTVEWGLAELIRNPNIMTKARNELKSILNSNQLVQESEIFKLPYLQAIVKETFRLHPAAPLSLPRQAKEDTQVFHYTIPKNAQILINVWAIGRDSRTWSDPEKFMPERFMDMETDFRGQHFELLPFGGGRRICPGLPLAQRMVHLMLANLIKDFNWTLEDGGMKCEEIDMEERPGITLHRANPLRIIPIRG